MDDCSKIIGAEDRRRRVKELKQICLLNRALCAVKAGNQTVAIAACNLVLEEERCNVKGALPTCSGARWSWLWPRCVAGPAFCYGVGTAQLRGAAAVQTGCVGSTGRGQIHETFLCQDV